MNDSTVHDATPAPMGSTESLALPSRGQATALVGEASRAWAETRAMMEYARSCPRNEELARLAVMQAAARPSFADSVTWEMERGKKKDPETGQWVKNLISGLSVHVAREIARHWQHIASGSRVLEDDGESIHGESYASDLQLNRHIRAQWIVRKVLMKKVWKDGQTVRDPITGKDRLEPSMPNDVELLQMQNATAAKAVRNCLLELFPDDLKEEVAQRADETLTQFAAGEIDATGKPTPKGAAKDGKCASAAVDRLVGEFRRLRVSLEMIERKLGHPVDDLTPDEYKGLARLGAAIKGGQTAVGEAFPAPEQPKAAEGPAASAAPAEEDLAALFDKPAPQSLDEVVEQHTHRAKGHEPKPAEPKPAPSSPKAGA